MARSATVPQEVAAQELSAEEQAQFEQMRDDAPEAVEPEAPAETELEPDPAAEAEVAATPERRNTAVPLAALQEERERRKAAEAAIAERDRRMQTLEERTNILLQNLGRAPQAAQPEQPQTAEIEIPDVRTDPVGHIIATQQKIQRDLERVQGGNQQQQQLLQTAQVVNAIKQAAVAQERQFAAEAPDYPVAVEHLKNLERRRLQLAGYTDPAVVENMIDSAYLDIAARSLQAGQNPAKQVYEMARLYGYQPPAPAAEGETTESAQQPTAQQNLARVANGQRQNRSLTGTRGAAPVQLTAQRLVEMSESEFARMMETEEGRALLGS